MSLSLDLANSRPLLSKANEEEPQTLEPTAPETTSSESTSMVNKLVSGTPVKVKTAALVVNEIKNRETSISALILRC